MSKHKSPAIVGNEEWLALQAAVKAGATNIDAEISAWLASLGWTKSRINKVLRSEIGFEGTVNAMTRAGLSSHTICKVVGGLDDDQA